MSKKLILVEESLKDFSTRDGELDKMRNIYLLEDEKENIDPDYEEDSEEVNLDNPEDIEIFDKVDVSDMDDEDDVIVVPLNTAMYRLMGTKYINSMDVQVNDANLMDRVTERIKKLIMMLHRLPPDKDNTIDDRAPFATGISAVRRHAYTAGTL